jgi:translation initiation factor IF-2
LLEAEMLELKANPDKRAAGTIIESSLDRGRGYVATVLVQSGTLKVGDIVLAGQNYGHVKAMFNERNTKIDKAGPAAPAIILGLDGAPQAGDKFHVFENEREARQIANKREQLAREQGLRTQKHITLDEIGRRIAIGNFQELNLIVKGDVDGSSRGTLRFPDQTLYRRDPDKRYPQGCRPDIRIGYHACVCIRSYCSRIPGPAVSQCT